MCGACVINVSFFFFCLRGGRLGFRSEIEVKAWDFAKMPEQAPELSGSNC
jgi:hypothetical protein